MILIGKQSGERPLDLQLSELACLATTLTTPVRHTWTLHFYNNCDLLQEKGPLGIYHYINFPIIAKMYIFVSCKCRYGRN